MNAISITTSLLTHSLAWALLYSLWQGAVIYCILYILLKALPNIGARVKHYLSFSAFMALFVWFLQTLVTQYSNLGALLIYTARANTSNSSPGTTYYLRIHVLPAQAPIVREIQPQIESYIPYLILAYAVGLCFMLCRFIIDLLALRALKTKGVTIPEVKWNDLLARLQKQFTITRPVRLLLSARVTIPMMLGAVRPVILLPIATINHLSVEQVEAILLHELAHIKRHDYLLNAIQTIIEAILFFNPFVWLISRVIRREREHCCDDLVVANTASPLPYAKALAMLENARQGANNVALAATGHKQQLLARIKRIMETKKSKLNYTQLTIVIVALLAITVTVAMFTSTRSFAQKAKKSNSNDTAVSKSAVNDPGPGSQPQPASAKQAKGNKDTKAAEVYNYQTDSFWTAKVKVVTDEWRKSEFYPPDTIANNHSWNQDKELKYADNELHGTEWEKLKQQYNTAINDYMKSLTEGHKRENGIYKLPKINAATEREMKETLIEFENAPDEIKNNSHVKNLYSNILFDGSGIAFSNLEDSILEDMQRDKLIGISRSKKTYVIKKENGALYINDVKQQETAYTKYGNYVGDRILTIYITKHGWQINFDNKTYDQTQ